MRSDSRHTKLCEPSLVEPSTHGLFYGEFGTAVVPVDRVESLVVLMSLFVAEHGSFTTGMISIETRRGTKLCGHSLRRPPQISEFLLSRHTDFKGYPRSVEVRPEVFRERIQSDKSLQSLGCPCESE